MTAIAAELLLDACRRHLGSDARIIAPQFGSNGTQLLLVDTAGGTVVVKRHRNVGRHVQEINAYKRWTAALREDAPRLLGVDQDVRAVILSHAPGDPMGCADLSSAQKRPIFASMGDALRRYHSAAPARDDIDMVSWLAGRGVRWLDAARHVISAGDRITIRAHLRALEGLGRLSAVPCHLDFTPRNIIVGARGITVIDFEHSRYDLAARDLVRLATRTWPQRPESRAAFVSGYGPLTDLDKVIVEHCAHIDRLTAMARAAGIEIGPREPPG